MGFIQDTKDIYNGKPWFLYTKYSNAYNLSFLIQQCGYTIGWIIGSSLPWLMGQEETDFQLFSAIVGWMFWLVAVCEFEYYFKKKKHIKIYGENWFEISNQLYDRHGAFYIYHKAT